MGQAFGFIFSKSLIGNDQRRPAAGRSEVSVLEVADYLESRLQECSTWGALIHFLKEGSTIVTGLQARLHGPASTGRLTQTMLESLHTPFNDVQNSPLGIIVKMDFILLNKVFSYMLFAPLEHLPRNVKH